MPKPVNTLCIVADHADILLLFGQVIYQCELQSVRVLIFVNENVLKAFVVLLASLGGFPEQFDGLDQQVVKIESVRRI